MLKFHIDFKAHHAADIMCRLVTENFVAVCVTCWFFLQNVKKTFKVFVAKHVRKIQIKHEALAPIIK